MTSIAWRLAGFCMALGDDDVPEAVRQRGAGALPALPGGSGAGDDDGIEPDDPPGGAGALGGRDRRR
jgi:hypothetical protein